MSKYSDDLSQEKKPAGLIPEGQRLVKVLNMEASTSKGGNRMFITSIEDVETKTSTSIYLVSEPKKRWMLKSLLNAVGLEGGQDGIYSWSEEDVIGKEVIATVEHYDEPWINRLGEEVLSKKSKITDFSEATNLDTAKENEAWEE